MMRVLTGKFKGQTLKRVFSDETRETSEILKQAVFNSLFDLNNKVFLDLFAGCGQIGIEALSRGAKLVYFNDRFLKSEQTVLENLALCKADKSTYEVKRLDYLDYLGHITAKGVFFDYIFLDPPFNTNYYKNILHTVKDILKPNGKVAIECKADFEDFSVAGYTLEKSTVYSNKKLLIFQKEN